MISVAKKIQNGHNNVKFQRIWRQTLDRFGALVPTVRARDVTGAWTDDRPDLPPLPSPGVETEVDEADLPVSDVIVKLVM